MTRQEKHQALLKAHSEAKEKMDRVTKDLVRRYPTLDYVAAQNLKAQVERASEEFRDLDKKVNRQNRHREPSRQLEWCK